MEKYRLEIRKCNDELNIYVYEDGTLIETYKENIHKKRLEGNIYLGVVKDVIKGMQAAFIDIGEEKNALIHIKDIIQKESNVTGNINLDEEKYKIQDILKPGKNILVQIKRDCEEQKGSRATRDIKLTGKYIVLMPYSEFITTSSKIEDNEEKDRLIDITKKYLKDGYGAIIRTSAEGKDEKTLKNDIEVLKALWNKILTKEKINENTENKTNEEKGLTAPKLIYNNNGIIGKLITDFQPLGIQVFVDSEKTKKYIEGNINKDIKVQIKEIEEVDEFPHKIWLKCGGFITIDKCDALTAIDVNSGKFTGKNDIEDTVLKVNLEATNEIARQLRLRDIGGIVIVDYIDMNKEEDRIKVSEQMKKAVKSDRSKVQVLEFTKLGLLEITRKHILGR